MIVAEIARDEINKTRPTSALASASASASFGADMALVQNKYRQLALAWPSGH